LGDIAKEVASSEGGYEIQVETDFFEDSKPVLGSPIAIKKDQIAKLFEPFTRGDTARGSEGNGLGLAIVKRIMSQHHGSVVVNNRSEGGLKVQISFPTAK
jgi:two-component system osmolarity sensor histidine kinase EnvZ